MAGTRETKGGFGRILRRVLPRREKCSQCGKRSRVYDAVSGVGGLCRACFEKGGGPNSGVIQVLQERTKWEKATWDGLHTYYVYSGTKPLSEGPFFAAATLEGLLARLKVPDSICYSCDRPETSDCVETSLIGFVDAFNIKNPKLTLSGDFSLRLPACTRCKQEGKSANFLGFYLVESSSLNLASDINFYVVHCMLPCPRPGAISDFARAFWKLNWPLAIQGFYIALGKGWHERRR